MCDMQKRRSQWCGGVEQTRRANDDRLVFFEYGYVRSIWSNHVWEHAKASWRHNKLCGYDGRHGTCWESGICFHHWRALAAATRLVDTRPGLPPTRLQEKDGQGSRERMSQSHKLAEMTGCHTRQTRSQARSLCEGRAVRSQGSMDGGGYREVATHWMYSREDVKYLG